MPLPKRTNKGQFLSVTQRSVLSACMCLLIEHPAKAQEDNEQRLLEVEKQLEESRSQEQLTKAERQRIERELKDLRVNLVETAKRIKAQEQALKDAKDQISGLQSQEEDITADLEVQRTELSSFLGALQSMQRQRPPALLVNPDDAAKAVRSAILLNDIIPHLNEKTKQISGELENLKWVRQSINDEETRLTLAEIALKKDHQEIERLIVDKEEREQSLRASLAIERARISKLATEADSLKALIKRLEQEASLASLRPSLPMSPDEQGQVADFRFSQARGTLQLPVIGEISLKFGQNDQFGQKNQGLQIRTSENAQVVTPFDGKIVYAGPFLDHEQLLLIEAGEGYHILISGMARIYGQVGDRLLSGEPVGVMEAQETESQDAETDGKDPTLYLEFRKNGDPINPMPWMSPSSRKVSG